MPWQLKAEGHALGEAAEKKLFRLLAKVFKNEDFGTAHPVQFAGDHVSGNALSPEDLESASKDTVDDDEPQAALVPKGEAYPAQTHEPVLEPEGVEHPADGSVSPAVTNEGGHDDANDVGNSS